MNLTRPLTKAEEHCLVRFVRRRASARDRVIITGVLFAGMELQEIRRLRVCDVYTSNQVRASLTLPSSSPRSEGSFEMPITPEFHRALRLLRDEAKGSARLGCAPLIANDERSSLSRKGLTRVIQRAIRRAGIRDDRQLGPGSLRKRFARKIWAAGNENMLILRDALRHWSVSQAVQYLDLERGRVERAMRERHRVAA